MSRSKSKASPWELHNRPAAPALTVILVCALLCVIAWFWQYRVSVPKAAVSSGAASPVRLNELMSSNKSAVLDNNGKYSDWIELLNPSDQAVDISGWKLSDGGSIFTFPEHIMQPGEAVIVYASGSIHALPGEAFHAPFRLSASGETVTLTDSAEHPVDTAELPPLDANISYARVSSGGWEETVSFTPGLSNDQPYRPAEEALVETGLIISEVMPKNASYSPDKDGDFSDYIELYNSSNADIRLNGFLLSDNSAKRDKWSFPDVTIGRGQYLIVYASGKDSKSGELHTNFSLSADGEGLFLSDPQGRLIEQMSYTGAEADMCWSSSGGQWTNALPPSPGYSNDIYGAYMADILLQRANTAQVYLTEALCSSRSSDDWVELHNESNQPVDLSGWGLSDSSSRPRKWQFPEGTSIAPGQYLVVYLSGMDASRNGQYHASFSLSAQGGETLTLCRPDGMIVDRLLLGRQYADISCGRVSGLSGLLFFREPTPGSANTAVYYPERTEQVAFSEQGGVKSGAFTLTLTSSEGAQIYYTTDCTEPTTASTRYTGPIQISSTTVVRAIAVKDGWLESVSSAHTYLFGVSHTLPVVSLVSDPDGMFGAKNGMYTNYEEEWERSAHIEYFTASGQTLFSQGADISLHGNDARLCDQKTFNVIARSEYGDNRFRAAIFPNRDYTEYQSFLLRPSSEDSSYTRMRCSILSTLLDETTVMHQDTVPAVLYINGEYWGHYNLRERTNAHAIAQWEGWTDPDRIDLVKGNAVVMQGSNDSFKALLSWLKDHSLRDEANLAYVKTQVDVENYLDYAMLQIFASNSDLLNVKRYRSAEGDNRWRWMVFDLDWAFHNDTNSWADWIGYDGRAPRDGTNVTLFRALMENEGMKEYFFRLLGQRLATTWSAETIIRKFDERAALIEPEMEATYAKFEGSVKRWREKVDLIKSYTLTRPAKLIGYIAGCEDLSEAEIEEYFGEALSVNPLP